MTIQEATVQRIKELCLEQEITGYKLTNRIDTPPSTVKSIISGKSKNPGIRNIYKIAAGLEVSIPDFFGSELFNNLDDESEES